MTPKKQAPLAKLPPLHSVIPIPQWGLVVYVYKHGPRCDEPDNPYAGLFELRVDRPAIGHQNAATARTFVSQEASEHAASDILHFTAVGMVEDLIAFVNKDPA